jgi:hypothetical protein
MVDISNIITHLREKRYATLGSVDQDRLLLILGIVGICILIFVVILSWRTRTSTKSVEREMKIYVICLRSLSDCVQSEGIDEICGRVVYRIYTTCVNTKSPLPLMLSCETLSELLQIRKQQNKKGRKRIDGLDETIKALRARLEMQLPRNPMNQKALEETESSVTGELPD